MAAYRICPSFRWTLRLTAGALALCSALPAEAAPKVCFRPAEITAEQAILYQTDLMVAAQACRNDAYGAFTQRNRDAIIAYQHDMIEHFRRSGAKRAESRFETYLTHLANAAALRTSQLPVNVFCAGATPMLADANGLDAAGFRQLAEKRAADSQARYKLCAGK